MGQVSPLWVRTWCKCHPESFVWVGEVEWYTDMVSSGIVQTIYLLALAVVLMPVLMLV